MTKSVNGKNKTVQLPLAVKPLLFIWLDFIVLIVWIGCLIEFEIPIII